MKKILLILLMFLLVLTITSKNANATPCGVLYNDTLNTTANWTLSAGCTIDSTKQINCDAGDSIRFLNFMFSQSQDPSNFSVYFDYKSTVSQVNSLYFSVQNLSAGVNPSATIGYNTFDSVGGKTVLRTYISGNPTFDTLLYTDDDVGLSKRFRFKFTINQTLEVYKNQSGNVMVLNQTQTHNNISYFGSHTGQALTFVLDNFVITNDSASCGVASITNNSPVVAINTPINNSQTHNQTIFINFTITNANNDNATYQMFLDTSSNPTTKINESNITQGNFTFITSLTTQVAGSINGTYYLKINGTDNESNVFSYFNIFNLTNDLNQYNITNVSITPLPLNTNTQAKCHFNITNKANVLTSLPNQTDNISISDLRWYLNHTLLATGGNQTLLNAPNATLNANITCEVRINNGFGATAWTQYVNSSDTTVGDTTAPTINSFSLPKTSFTSTEIVNITANVTDNTILNFVRVTIDSINYSMSSIGNDIFQYAVTWAIGQHNISYFIAQDTSSNTQTNASTINFSVTSAPSGGGSSGGGGGGGGGSITTVEQITILGNLSLLLKPPIIQSTLICGTFKQNYCKFSITLESNKVLDKCISSLFSCMILRNSTVLVELNYSNSSSFISKAESSITLIDKSSLAKEIDATVRFINLGYSFPFTPDTKSKNYIIFELSNDIGIEGKRSIQGIRAWFALALLATIMSGAYLFVKYG